jgi:hypothetical protein
VIGSHVYVEMVEMAADPHMRTCVSLVVTVVKFKCFSDCQQEKKYINE